MSKDAQDRTTKWSAARAEQLCATAVPLRGRRQLLTEEHCMSSNEAIAAKLAHNIGVILDQARRHGTLGILKNVALYFTADELRVILVALTREQEAVDQDGR